MNDRSTWRPLGPSPGFYVDAAGVLHLDEDEAIRGAGYEPTDASRRAVRQAAADLAAQVGFDLVLDEP